MTGSFVQIDKKRIERKKSVMQLPHAFFIHQISQ